MLIFEFGDKTAQAEKFAAACRERGKEAFVWASQDAMHEGFMAEQDGSDIFPFVINGVVVTVDRDDAQDVERSFQNLAPDFDGRFVGT